MIYKVHDAMEGRDELTGYDLHMIHGTLCDITPNICDLCKNGTPKQTGNMFVCPKCGAEVN